MDREKTLELIDTCGALRDRYFGYYASAVEHVKRNIFLSAWYDDVGRAAGAAFGKTSGQWYSVLKEGFTGAERGAESIRAAQDAIRVADESVRRSVEAVERAAAESRQ